LSADELNTIFARDPQFIARKIKLFVTMTGNEATVQGSVPTDSVPQMKALLSDRYFNFNFSANVDFNPDNHTLNLVLHSLQLADQPTPANGLTVMQTEFNTLLNLELQKNPAAKNLLDHAQTIAIQDGQLVIQTK
jgi:hypothetical protein